MAEAERTDDRRALAAWAVALGLFALLRLLPCRSELWLDEVWALDLVGRATSLVEVAFVRVENHLAYSLYLYAVGREASELVLRLPAWVAGVAAVALSGLLAGELSRRTGPRAPVGLATSLGTGLAGFSYLQLHYAAEARGYAPALAFGLLALWLIARGLDRPERRWPLAYGLALIAGALFHPIAAHAAVAGGGWSLWVWRRDGAAWPEVVRHALSWHLLPFVAYVALYVGWLSTLQTGGGPTLPLLEVLGETSLYTLGLPAGVPRLAWVVAILLFGFALRDLLALSGRLAPLFVLGIVVSPALAGVIRGALLYPRYFLFSSALLLVLLAVVLAERWRRRARRPAIAVLLLAFALGNHQHTALLLRNRRAHYGEALAQIDAFSPPGPVTLATDHDFRNRICLDHYAARAPRVRYVTHLRLPSGGTDWFLVHRARSLPAGYLEVAHFPAAPLSGWSLTLGRRRR